MYVIEIFTKKRRFSAIYKTVWPLISASITYPPATENEPEQKLIFFGALTYGTVYQSALAAGMTTSAAHYMARMLLRNLKFDDWMTEAVIAIFAPSDDEEEQTYAASFLTRIASLIETIRGRPDAIGAAETADAMLELSRIYRKVDFTPA
jgi:hypothetical protein